MLVQPLARKRRFDTHSSQSQTLITHDHSPLVALLAETERIDSAVGHYFAVAIIHGKVTAKIHSEIDSLRLILIIMALLPTR
jgi:hypothetical protein